MPGIRDTMRAFPRWGRIFGMRCRPSAPRRGPSGNRNPYFDEKAITAADVTSRANFSPNRVICGPGMWGSMSSGVQEGIPWRTLLFRPDPEHFGAADQPNKGDPPDHLWMDLFWMPVVEPYAISMPGATRGKISMNTQIVPFDYIKRHTAIHALSLIHI